MPTYEYECAACGHRFELFQKISDPPTKACPGCRKAKATRRISGGVGVIFKGSGFYSTDNKRTGGDGGARKTSRHKKEDTPKKPGKEGS